MVADNSQTMSSASAELIIGSHGYSPRFVFAIVSVVITAVVIVSVEGVR